MTTREEAEAALGRLSHHCPDYGRYTGSSMQAEDVKTLRAFIQGQDVDVDYWVKAQPSDNYDSLKKQFSALKSMCASIGKQLSHYQNKDYTLSEQRLKTLEEALDSEREMNAILTEENQDHLNQRGLIRGNDSNTFSFNRDPTRKAYMRLCTAVDELKDEIVHFENQRGDCPDEKEVLERAIGRMGWDEINAFYEQKGQSVYEDAGGYILRKIKCLFGIKPKEKITTYQDACKAMLEAAPKMEE